MATLDDYRRREHWSFSSINQFLNICSLQWALQRLYKIKPAFTPVNLSFGSAFHRVMESVSATRKDGATPVKEEAADLFDDLWHRQVEEDKNIKFDEGMGVEELSQQGRELTACIVDAFDPEERVVQINEAFAVPVIDSQGNMLERPLIGEIDLVVEKQDIRTLVDWKTSAKRWTKTQADKSMQPTVFLYAYRQLHGVDLKFRFDVVVKNKKPVFEQHETTRTEDNFHRTFELIKTAESMIRHEHFYPNETCFYCGSCPFSKPCREWHRNRSKLVSIAA